MTTGCIPAEWIDAAAQESAALPRGLIYLARGQDKEAIYTLAHLRALGCSDYDLQQIVRAALWYNCVPIGYEPADELRLALTIRAGVMVKPNIVAMTLAGVETEINRVDQPEGWHAFDQGWREWAALRRIHRNARETAA